MLGKLMKYEWKDTYKAGCLMLGAVALITFMGWLAFQSPMWTGMGYDSRFGWLDVISILTLLMYVVMLVVVNYGITIYLGVHFYKTMYTDQGYLTHTLPVTKGQILVSKILISGLWVFIVLLSIFLSVLLLGAALLSVFMPDGYSLSDLWREFYPYLRHALSVFEEELDFYFTYWLISFIIVSLVTPFVTMTILFGAISMGQLFSKYRVLMAILSYIGITIVVSLINSLINSMASLTMYGSFGVYINSSINYRFFVNLAAAAVLYFVSWYVTNKKLNMP